MFVLRIFTSRGGKQTWVRNVTQKEEIAVGIGKLLAGWCDSGYTGSTEHRKLSDLKAKASELAFEGSVGIWHPEIIGEMVVARMIRSDRITNAEENVVN